MAAQKSNPNLTQAQFLALAARVNDATSYSAQDALSNKLAPKETAQVVAAKKTLKDYEDKVKAARNKASEEVRKAKTIAMDAVLFGSQQSAIAAVKALEGKF